MSKVNFDFIKKLKMKEAVGVYNKLLQEVRGTDNYFPLVAELGRQDRFFLLAYILHRPDVIDPFIYDRCREVETDSDGFVDLYDVREFSDNWLD